MDDNGVCKYSYTHWVKEVPSAGHIAIPYVDSNGITLVPACTQCQDFYKEQSK